MVGWGCSAFGRRSSISSWNFECGFSTSAIVASTAGGGISRPSGAIVQWSCVIANSTFRPVFASVTPRSNQSASLARSAPALKPTPSATFSAPVRP